MKGQRRTLNRRHFFRQTLGGAGLCTLGEICSLSGAGRALAAERSVNPFPYDIERLASTDPKWLKYEQTKIISGLHPGVRRIAIGPGDRLYIANRSGVQVLDAEGTPLSDIPTKLPARCVAVDGDGRVYIGMRSQVELVDAKGQPLATWPTPGPKTWLTGLSVSGNSVFAADSGSRVVWRHDRSGKILGRIGDKNPERHVQGLIVPSPYLDVKAGPDGLLRINNPGRHRVEVFTPDGDLEMFWGKPGGGIAGFCGCCNPIGLAMLPDGRCITCEKGLPRVKVFSTAQTLESVVAGPELFEGNGRAGRLSASEEGPVGGLDAVVDSKGRVYVLDLAAENVRVMKPKT